MKNSKVIKYISYINILFKQGKLDSKDIPHSYGLGNIDQEVRKIETYPELLAKFEAKANES